MIEPAAKKDVRKNDDQNANPKCSKKARDANETQVKKRKLKSGKLPKKI
jgi:hypothetical protein